MSAKNKRHQTIKWYDGFLYSKLITPLEGELISLINELIPVGSTVIDIGCGPGSLVMKQMRGQERIFLP